MRSGRHGGTEGTEERQKAGEGEEERRLVEAWEALRGGEEERCIQLGVGLDTPELRKARPGLVGRALAFAAQAALRRGEAGRAHGWLLDAIRLAKAAGEVEALPALRTLHGEASAQLAALQAAEEQRRQDQALMQVPLEEILAEPEPGARVDRLIRQAGALADAGRAAEAAARAEIAVGQAADLRGRVIGLLLLARVSEGAAQEAHVLAAWRMADAEDDQNLIAFAARAAKMIGVEIPTPGF